MPPKKLVGSVVFVLAFLAIPASVFWYYSDNIAGYYRFKSYCAKESGLRVYHEIKKNEIWMAEDISSARAAATLRGVRFSRYIDKSTGKLYDVSYSGGDARYRESFNVSLASPDAIAKYKLRFLNERLPGEVRMGRSGYEVLDIESEETEVRFYNFGYSVFDVNRTLLSSPSNVACFSSPHVYLEEIQKTIQ